MAPKSADESDFALSTLNLAAVKVVAITSPKSIRGSTPSMFNMM